MLTQATEFLRLCHIDRMGHISHIVFKRSLVASLCRDDINRNFPGKQLYCCFCFTRSIATFTAF